MLIHFITENYYKLYSSVNLRKRSKNKFWNIQIGPGDYDQLPFHNTHFHFHFRVLLELSQEKGVHFVPGLANRSELKKMFDHVIPCITIRLKLPLYSYAFGAAVH